MLQTHKKDKAFHKIAEALPGRTTSEVVKQYYLWKKRGKHRVAIERLAQDSASGNDAVGVGTTSGDKINSHKKKSHHQRHHHSAGVSAVPATAADGREASQEASSAANSGAVGMQCFGGADCLSPCHTQCHTSFHTLHVTFHFSFHITHTVSLSIPHSISNTVHISCSMPHTVSHFDSHSMS